MSKAPKESLVTRVLHTESIPVVFDFFSDRVYSRTLSVSLFALVFLYVLRSGLYVLFLDPLASEPSTLPPDLNLLTGTGYNDIQIGASIVPVTSVKLQDPSTKAPISDRLVELSFSLLNPETNDWSTRFGYSNSIYDMTGVPINNRFSFPGFVPASLRDPVITGNSQRTDVSGFARFRKLSMSLGIPAQYSVTVKSGRSVSADVTNFVFSSTVSHVQVGDSGGLSMDSSFTIGQTLPKIVAYVTDITGAGIGNKRVLFLSSPPSADEFSSLASSNDLFHPRFATFSGSLSTLTDNRGVATFSGISITASSLSRIRAVLVCDGAISLPIEFRIVDPVTITITKQPSTSVIEGDFLKEAPIVKVTRNGLPVSGYRVMAFPAMRAGFISQSLAAPELISEMNILAGTRDAVLNSLGRAKHTTGFISLKTNASGLTTWSSLGFLRHGPAGNYTLAFACNGIDTTIQTNIINVKTSVAKVEFFSPSITTNQYKVDQVQVIEEDEPVSSFADEISSETVSDPLVEDGLDPQMDSYSEEEAASELAYEEELDEAITDAEYEENYSENVDEEQTDEEDSYYNDDSVASNEQEQQSETTTDDYYNLDSYDNMTTTDDDYYSDFYNDAYYDNNPDLCCCEIQSPQTYEICWRPNSTVNFGECWSDDQDRCNTITMNKCDTSVEDSSGGNCLARRRLEISKKELNQPLFHSRPTKVNAFVAKLAHATQSSKHSTDGLLPRVFSGRTLGDNHQKRFASLPSLGKFPNAKMTLSKFSHLTARRLYGSFHLDSLSFPLQKSTKTGKTTLRRLQTKTSVSSTAVYSVTVCSFPTCSFIEGSSSGWPVYNEVNKTFKASSLPFSKPPGPSGYFSKAPSLIITDKKGRPLAGKSASPIIMWLKKGVYTTPTKPYIVQEFPGTGAGVSRLSLPISLISKGAPQTARSEGVLPYFSSNVRAYSLRPGMDFVEQNRFDFGKETGDFGSFLRMVVTPRKADVPLDTSTMLGFVVEGIVTKTLKNISITNLDENSIVNSAVPSATAANTCAFIEITATPKNTLITKATELFPGSPGRESSNFNSPFTVRTLNSFGEPVPTPAVSMQVVDALGLLISGDTNTMNTLTSQYIDYLKMMGGASAFTMSNITASKAADLWLMGPASYSNSSAMNGVHYFSKWSPFLAQNTYIQFAFVSNQPDIFAKYWRQTLLKNMNETIRKWIPQVDQQTFDEYYSYYASILFSYAEFANELLPSPSSCVSGYSKYIAINSAVSSISWLNTTIGQPKKFTSSKDLSISDFINPFPVPLVKDDKNLIIPGTSATVKLITIMNEKLTTGPAYIGAYSQDPFKIYPSIEAYTAAFYFLPFSVDFETNLFGENSFVFANAAFLPTISSTFGLITSVFGFSETNASNAFTTFDKLYPTPGNPGDYPFVGFSQGVLSPPLPPLVITDDVNILIVKDWSKDNCPPQFLATVNRDDDNDPLISPKNIPRSKRKILGGCESDSDCSGHGSCECGWCVCHSDWSGSANCNVTFYGDLFGSTFSNDPMYTRYGGLPVLDMRLITETARNFVDYDNNKLDYVGEFFPQFLFPAYVAVGHADKLDAISTSALNAVTRLKGAAGLTPVMRALDYVNFAFADSTPNTSSTPWSLKALGATVTFSKLMQTGAYQVFPVLVTCGGKEMPDAYFTKVFPGCSADRVSIASQPAPLTFGLQNFENIGWPYQPYRNISLSVDINRTDTPPFEKLSYPSTTPGSDSRILLKNVPTGCYRLKYVYAPRDQGGSLSKGIIDNMLESAQTSTLGYSRPFRVLSPVTSIDVDPMPSFVVVRDSKPLIQPSVKLRVRPHPTKPTSAFKDKCSDAALLASAKPGSIKIPKGGKNRCPSDGRSGLEVTISAVEVSSGAEYPLYQSQQQYDCTRARFNVTNTGMIEYSAKFSNFYVPRNPDYPPSDRKSGSVGEIPVGVYKLKFSSYGTSAISDYTMTVVNTPTAIFGGRLDAFSQNAITLRATVGKTAKDFVSPVINVSCLAQLVDPGYAQWLADNGYINSRVLDATNKALQAIFAMFEGVSTDEYSGNTEAKVSEDDLSITSGLQGESASGSSTLSSVVIPELSAGVPDVTIRVDVAFAPPNSNVELDTSNRMQITDDTGKVTFARLRFLRGISGIYFLSVSANTFEGTMLVKVNVSNPINSVSRSDLTYSKTVVLKAAEIKPTPISLKICPKDANGKSSFRNETIVVSIYIDFDALSAIKCSVLNATTTAQKKKVKECLSDLAKKRAAAGKTVPSGKIQIPSVGSSSLAKSEIADAAAIGVSDDRIPLDMRLDIAGTNLRKTSVPASAPFGSTAYVTGPDGCISISTLTFKLVRASVQVQVVFNARGIDSDPLKILVQTQADLNPVSIKGLQDRIVVPMLLAAPIFAVNSMWMSRMARAGWVSASVGCLLILWFFGGASFLDEIPVFASAMTDLTVDMISSLSIAYIVSLLATAIVVFVTIAFLLVTLCPRKPVVATSIVKNNLSSVSPDSALEFHSELFDDQEAKRTADLLRDALDGDSNVNASSYLSSSMFQNNGVSQLGPSAGFYGLKLQSSLDYSRANSVRMCKPLVTVTGELYPLVVDALSEVWERYASMTIETEGANVKVVGDVSVIACESAAHLNLLRDIHGLSGYNAIKVKTFCGDNKIETPKVISGPATESLKSFLLTAHLGVEAVSAIEKVGEPILDVKVTSDMFSAAISHRLDTGYAGSVVSDLSFLSGHTIPRSSFSRATVTFKDEQRCLSSLYGMRSCVANRSKNVLSKDMEDVIKESFAGSQSQSEGFATVAGLLDLFAPGLAPFIRILEKPGCSLSREEFIVIYHIRLASKAAAVARNDLNDKIPAIKDCDIWTELSAWGFDRYLNLKSCVLLPGPSSSHEFNAVVAAANDKSLSQASKQALQQRYFQSLYLRATPRAHTALTLAFQRAALFDKNGNPKDLKFSSQCSDGEAHAKLDYSSLNEFHRVNGLPDIRRADFRVICEQAGSSSLEFDVDMYLRWLQLFSRDAESGSSLSTSQELEAHCAEHIRALLLKSGYSNRLQYVGVKEVKATSGDVSIEKSKSVSEYIKYIKKDPSKIILEPLVMALGFEKKVAADALALNSKAPLSKLRDFVNNSPTALIVAQSHGKWLAQLSIVSGLKLKVFSLPSNSKSAFFYPQRLLTAFFVSVCGIFFMACFLLFNIKLLIDELDQFVVGYKQQATDLMMRLAASTLSLLDLTEAQISGVANVLIESITRVQGAATNAAATAKAAIESANALRASASTNIASLSKTLNSGSAGQAGALENFLASTDAASAAALKSTGNAAASFAAALSGAASTTTQLPSSVLASIQSLPMLLRAALYTGFGISTPDSFSSLPRLASRLNATSAKIAALSVNVPAGVPQVIRQLITGELSSKEAVDKIVQFVGGTFFAQIDELVEAVKLRLWIVGISATVVSLLLVCTVLYIEALSYQSIILKARRGRYPEGYSKKTRKVAGAANFIGLQLALAITSYIGLVPIIAIAVFVLTLTPIYTVIYKLLLAIIPTLLSLALVLNFLQKYLLNNVLAKKDTIFFPRLYNFVDLYFNFIGLFLGLAIGFGRFIVGVVVQMMVLMRMDMSAIADRNKDPATMSFDNVVMIDIQFNHPIRMAAIHLFIESLHRIRERRRIPITDEDKEKAEHDRKRFVRVRNRFFLAFMLSRVPALRKSRVSGRGLLPLPGPDLVEKLRRRFKMKPIRSGEEEPEDTIVVAKDGSTLEENPLHASWRKGGKSSVRNVLGRVNGNG